MGDRTRKPSTKQAGIIHIFDFEKERDIQEISQILRTYEKSFVYELGIVLQLHQKRPLPLDCRQKCSEATEEIFDL